MTALEVKTFLGTVQDHVAGESLEELSAFVHLSDYGIQTAESLALTSTINIRDCLVLQESEGTWKTASFGLGLVLED